MKLRVECYSGTKADERPVRLTLPVYNPTGQVWRSPLFVAAPRASSYTFAEATRDQQMESWLRRHVRRLESLDHLVKSKPGADPGRSN